MAYVPPWKRAAAAASADEPTRGPASMPERTQLTLHIMSNRFGFLGQGTLTPFGFPPVHEDKPKRSEGTWGREGEEDEENVPEVADEKLEDAEQPAAEAAIASEPVVASEPVQVEEDESDDEQAKEIPLPGQNGNELGPKAPVEPIAKLSLADEPKDEVDPSFTTVPRKRNGPAHHPHASKIAYITLYNSQPQFPKELWCHSNAHLLTDPKGKYENWGKLVPVYKSLGKAHGFKFEGWWRIKSAKAVVPGSEELIKMLETKEAMRNYSPKGRDPAAWKESLEQTWIKVYGAKLSINEVLRLKLKDPLQIQGSSEEVQQYLLTVRDTQ